MTIELFTVDFVKENTCFLYFSEKWTKKFRAANISAVKLELNESNSADGLNGLNKSKTAYFSWRPLFSLPNHVVGISPQNAQLSGIHKNETVTIKFLGTAIKIQRVVVSPCSKDDWEILELNADLIQSTLLNHVRVVYIGQKLLIWITKSIDLVVNVKQIDPNVQYGFLDVDSEVEVIPVLDANLTEEKVVDENDELHLKDVFRVHLTSVDNGDELTEFNQPFNGFAWLPKIFNDIESVTCEVKKVERDSKIDRKSAFVRVYNLSYSKSNLSSELLKSFKKYNYNVVYLNGATLRLLNIRLKSHVIVESLRDDVKLSKCEAIELFSISPTESCIIGDIFKLYVTKNKSVFLNSNVILDITSNVKCYVKIVPGEFTTVSENSLEDVSIKIKTGYDDIAQKLQRQNDFNFVNSFLSKIPFNPRVWSVSCFEEIRKKTLDVFNFGVKFNSAANILVVGNAGSGKTTFANVICQATNDQLNFFTKIIDCRLLKSKKWPTLQKLFSETLDECCLHKPALVVFDDLEEICGKSNESDAQSIESESHYFNRNAQMLPKIIKDCQENNLVFTLCTAKSKSTLNDSLVTLKGQHFFDADIKMPVLDKNYKIELFEILLAEKEVKIDEKINLNQELALKLDGYCLQDLADLSDRCLFEAFKRHGDQKVHIIENDLESALKQTVPLSFRSLTLNSSISFKWDQIGGMSEVKTALIETILWPVKYPEIFATSPVKLQNGVLLYGYPGTGKTILAGAAAEHFGIRFISVKGPELLSKYIGASEEAVRNVFERAQTARPCILFFDEFDSLAPMRGHDNTGVTDRVVNQFLTQLDGVESLEGVYIIAATSRPDLLDPALIRPGRLGKHVQCPLPNLTERLSILESLGADLNFEEDVNLDELCRQTDGYTGADLQSILSTAQLTAVQNYINELEEDSIDDKLDPVRVTISHEQLLAALHETQKTLSEKEKERYDKIYRKFQKREKSSSESQNDGAFRVQKTTLA